MICSTLTIVLFCWQSAQKIFGGDIKNHILLFLKKEGGDDTISKFRDASADFKGKVSLVYSLDNLPLHVVLQWELDQGLPFSMRFLMSTATYQNAILWGFL